MINNQESLREQVMISQFEMATGCTREQSKHVLQSARWEFETGLSMFFQEAHVPSAAATVHQQHLRHPNGHLAPVRGMAPCNTPATPPSFPEALLALQKLQTGGAEWSNAGHTPVVFQTPKCLNSCTSIPLSSDNRLPQIDELPGNTEIININTETNHQPMAMAMSPPNTSMFSIEAQQ